MVESMVLGFLFNKTATVVVLIEKQKPEWQKGFLNGVGGKIEEGETPMQAMIREFKEETGVETTEVVWKPFAKLQGDDWEVYCFCGFSGNADRVKTAEREVVVIHDLSNPLPKAISNIPTLIELSLLHRLNDGFKVAVFDYSK